jgi:hypothetical protein
MAPSTAKSKKRPREDEPDAVDPGAAVKRNKKVMDPDLPSKTLTNEHKNWLRPYLDEYSRHVGKKGKHDSVSNWVRVTLQQPFVDKFFTTLTEDQHTRFDPIVAGVSFIFGSR